MQELGPGADDRGVGGALGPALQDDGHGRGLDLVLVDAGAAGQHGLPDGLRRELAVPAQGLDLRRRLDGPHLVDDRGDVPELHLRVALAQLLDAIEVGRQLVVVMAPGAAAVHQAGLGAGVVEGVPGREPEVEAAG